MDKRTLPKSKEFKEMDKIKAVLEEFNDNTPNCFSCYRTDCDKCEDMNKAISQALTQLGALYKEFYLGMLPKKKGRKICFGEDCTSDKVKSFNSAIQEMKRRVG